MYLYKRGLLPNSFNDIFFLNCDVHSCNNRSKNFFRLRYCRTKVGKFSLRFQGPKISNSPSSQIQNASSTALFNSKLKSFFTGLHGKPSHKMSFRSSVSQSGHPGEGKHESLVRRNDVLTNGFI